jgi:hypothetical protein
MAYQISVVIETLSEEEKERLLNQEIQTMTLEMNVA